MPSMTKGVASALLEDFESFGASMDRHTKPLHQRFLVICGQQGGGKSTLAESCPYGLIIDCDQSGEVNPDRKAVRIPTPGKPFEITRSEDDALIQGFGWEYIKEACKHAIRVKQADPDAPLMVFIDRVEKMVHWAIKWLEERRNRSIIDMHGQEAYGVIYKLVSDLLLEVHLSGCGLCLLTHAQYQDRAISDTEKVTELTHCVPKGLWKAISGDAEHCFYLHLARESEPIFEKKRQNGKLVSVKTGENERMVRHLISSKEDGALTVSLSQFVKTRLPLKGRVEIPQADYDAWSSVLEPAFTDAIDRFEKGVNSDDQG